MHSYLSRISPTQWEKYFTHTCQITIRTIRRLFIPAKWTSCFHGRVFFVHRLFHELLISLFHQCFLLCVAFPQNFSHSSKQRSKRILIKIKEVFFCMLKILYEWFQPCVVTRSKWPDICFPTILFPSPLPQNILRLQMSLSHWFRSIGTLVRYSCK